MASTVLKGLLATLLLAGAEVVAAQSFGVQSDVAAPVAPLSSPGTGFSPLPVNSAPSSASNMSAGPIVVAAISAPSDFVSAKSEHKQASSTTGGTRIKPWVLVLLGAFLIVTVSQRRATSIMD